MSIRFIVAISAVTLVLHGAYAGRVDILSDTVNIRTSGTQGNGKITRHYGVLRLETNAQGHALEAKNTINYPYDFAGVVGQCNISNSYGVGVYGVGGIVGVVGHATGSGGSTHIGGSFTGSGASTNAYGVWASVGTATNRYAVYGNCPDTSGQHWAGYFNGKIYATSLRQPSDARLKTDAQPLTGCISKIMQLKPQSYVYDTRANPKINLPSGRQYGLIAQELETVLPDLVSEVAVPDTSRNGTKTPETFKSVNYIALIPFLIGALQEQQKRIEELEARVGR